MLDEVVVTLKDGNKLTAIEGRRVGVRVGTAFSDPAASPALRALLAGHLGRLPGLVLCGDSLLEDLLQAHPDLADHAVAIVTDTAGSLAGRPTVRPDALPAEAKTVFLGHLDAVARAVWRGRLPSSLDFVEPDLVGLLQPDLIPAAAWQPIAPSIYPIHLPPIAFQQGLDMLLLDCPARNLALLPNGLGYVHNALKKTSVSFQTFDLDIVAYHRFHIHRLHEAGGVVTLESGRELPVDPWQAEHYDLWAADDVIAFFEPLIAETLDAIVAARPKAIGLSIHQCNEKISRTVVKRVRQELPDVVVVVGGFSCYNPEIGLTVFPEADYMAIGEADLSIGPLVEALARGERPANLPGILSRYDDPSVPFMAAPMPHNLDRIDFPRYEWFGIDIYRNWNGYQLVPVIASRGCRWSRCTFCAERFYWRIRTAVNFVDELEWLTEQGCTLFMFNESDLNGMPEKVIEICDEIIRRGLKIKLTGQLRIHKKSDQAFFRKLAAAGFVALRFGIDAFSANTLRLQRKGYTTETIEDNLRACWEAGIYTEVNWVIGVPGETPEDVEQGIQLILRNRDYIGRLANINPLILVNGSVYWQDPEAFGIRFREDQKTLMDTHYRAIPADKWYSVDPFIDAGVRKQWFEHIVLSLYDAGFPVGAWAQRIIEDVRLARDKNRAGAAAEEDTKELDWADSRGQYDPRHQQRKAGSAMKADSIGEADLAQPMTGHDIVVAVHDGQPIALHPDAIRQGFAAPTSAASRHAAPAPAGPKRGGPLERRLRGIADRLPSNLRARIRVAYQNHRQAGRRLTSPLMLMALTRAVAAYAIARVLGTTRRRVEETPVPGTSAKIVHVRGREAVPELMTNIGDYNIIGYDGRYLAVPQGTPIDWESDDLAAIDGVIIGRNVVDLRRAMTDHIAQTPLAAAALAPSVSPAALSSTGVGPVVLGQVGRYRIVDYEGWVYAIPPELIDVDLIEVDVMEMEGVFRDVSRDAVEAVAAEKSAALEPVAQ